MRPRLVGGAAETRDILSAASAEATHYDKNLFRSGPKLDASLHVLDNLWVVARDSLAGAGASVLRARETASIVATARWSYTAAYHRRESRGQHQREDATGAQPRFARRQTVRGLDLVRSDFA